MERKRRRAEGDINGDSGFEKSTQGAASGKPPMRGRDKLHGPPSCNYKKSNFKTTPYENFAKRTSTFGDRWHFAHGAEELHESGVYCNDATRS